MPGFSLLIAIFPPLHLYYSQTARGYSLIFFFTTLMVYASIKLLASKGFATWGLILVLSGFLSIYTIPTSVYFVFGLFGWAIFILVFPGMLKEFDWRWEYRCGKALIFFSCFVLTALLTYFAYLPLMDQVIVSATSYYMPKMPYVSKMGIALNFLPENLFYLFSGPLKVFLPFLLMGFFPETWFAVHTACSLFSGCFLLTW